MELFLKINKNSFNEINITVKPSSNNDFDNLPIVDSVWFLFIIGGGGTMVGKNDDDDDGSTFVGALRTTGVFDR